MKMLQRIEEIETRRVVFGGGQAALSGMLAQNSVNVGLGLSTRSNIHGGVDVWDNGHQVASIMSNALGGFTMRHEGGMTNFAPNLFGGFDER